MDKKPESGMVWFSHKPNPDCFYLWLFKFLFGGYVINVGLQRTKNYQNDIIRQSIKEFAFRGKKSHYLIIITLMGLFFPTSNCTKCLWFFKTERKWEKMVC